MKKLLAALLVAVTLLTAACEDRPPSGGNTSTPSDNASPADTSVLDTLPDAQSPETTEEPFRFTLDNMPRIDGSTATIPLIEAVYSVLLGIPRERAAEMVSTSGTDNAYSKLIWDDSGVKILLVYSPSPATLESAAEQGVELELAPIGRDGLVFLVNKANPVRSLTPEQLVSIYTGEIEKWSDVGGSGADIRAFQRPYMSGSQTMMDALVMKGRDMADTEPEYVIGEMGGLIEAVAAYDNAEGAIGYNVFYFVTQMEMNENVRLLAVSGVEPSTETISDGSYPFVSDFYAVIRKDAPDGSPERILFNWIQTQEGADLISHEGYATAGIR